MRDEPVGRRIGVENPYEACKVLLLDAVAGANRCRAIWSSSFGFVTVLGFAADIDAVELLFTSLLVQATTAMMHAGSRRDGHGRSTTRSFRQSFLTAFAQRIGERLATATSQATEQASRDLAGQPGADRLLPVLASRDSAGYLAGPQPTRPTSPPGTRSTAMIRCVRCQEDELHLNMTVGRGPVSEPRLVDSGRCSSRRERRCYR